ncbi:MAG: DUF808 domain-containing protein [Marinobacter sp.]|nr:DUF808 domain-containing protein [Marinobacter sp.]
MAAGSLLALIDDITTLLDDVSLMTKVATQKTAGVLGDDLALNAQQVTGVDPSRELPVVWAVAKGSLRNKAILVPAALAISFFVPWLVVPLLMLGGAFLCFEGFEKLVHSVGHASPEEEADKAALTAAFEASDADLLALEQGKIRGAIRTDFILSAEIITITLGTVSEQTLWMQCIVLSLVAVLLTIGVYGLVAGIVKLDDAGLYLSRRTGEQRSRRVVRAVGRGILTVAPYLMKTLSVLGTVAMFVVGGGIIVHGIPPLYDAIHHFAQGLADLPSLGGTLSLLTPVLVDGLLGIIFGAVVLGVVSAGRRIWPGDRADAE